MVNSRTKQLYCLDGLEKVCIEISMDLTKAHIFSKLNNDIEKLNLGKSQHEFSYTVLAK